MNFFLIFEKYQTQNIIATIALILAYLAYRKSIIDEYKSWLDLAKSFHSELKYAKEWLGCTYNGSIEEGWLDPSKIVYPLTSESARAMIWKGNPPKGLFPEGFFDKLTLFNERIQAFNHMLLLQGVNFIKSEYEDNKGIIPDKSSKERAKHINTIIHNHLIGNQNEFHLHNHYEYFVCELKSILKTDLNILPWYYKRPTLIVFSTLIFYLFIDYLIQ